MRVEYMPIVLSVIQTLITAMLVWYIQRALTKQEKKREAIDKARIHNELLIVQGVHASIKLGTATANSLCRLDSQCNGEMSKALANAEQALNTQTKFLQEQGLGAMFS